MTVDDLLREAERESRRELEQEALAAHELRACIPQIVKKAVTTALVEYDDHEPLAFAFRGDELVATIYRENIVRDFEQYSKYDVQRTCAFEVKSE